MLPLRHRPGVIARQQAAARKVEIERWRVRSWLDRAMTTVFYVLARGLMELVGIPNR